MGIVEATAEAPCPVFAGRGLDKRGFTLALPEKTYLSCTPGNIDQEKDCLCVYNYDLAEAAYRAEQDRAGFGVYVESGDYTETISDAKHLYAMDVFFELTADYSGKGSGERHNADVRSMRIQCEVRGALDGVAHAIYAALRVEEESGRSISGYYIAHTATYGGIAIEARTELLGNDDGDITIGTSGYGLVGILIAHKSSAVLTGDYTALAIHIPYDTSHAIAGTITGIAFHNNGLWIGTEYDIGISFGAECIKCIDVAGCAVFADADITMTGTDADNAMELVVTSTIVTASGYIQALQLNMNHSTGALTGTSELHVLALDTALTGGSSRGVPDWYALTIYMEGSANPVVGHACALSVYVTNLGNAITNYTLFDLGIDQSGGDPSSAFTWFKLQSHNATYMPKYVFQFHGENAAERLLYFANDNKNMISVHSSGSPSRNIKCYVEGVGELFIKLYDAA